MSARAIAIVLATFAALIVLSATVFFCCMQVTKRQRFSDADPAFRPLMHLRCQILSQPAAFYRYCRYVVDFPPDCELSDANVAELRSLNSLPAANTLDVTIRTTLVTNSSLPTLKEIG